jgi:S-adenosylmethionine synthetase
MILRPVRPASPTGPPMMAAGLADRAEVQVAYAIGVAHPVSVMVETFGTEKIGRGRIAQLVDEHLRSASPQTA